MRNQILEAAQALPVRPVNAARPKSVNTAADWGAANPVPILSFHVNEADARQLSFKERNRVLPERTQRAWPQPNSNHVPEPRRRSLHNLITKRKDSVHSLRAKSVARPAEISPPQTAPITTTLWRRDTPQFSPEGAGRSPLPPRPQLMSGLLQRMAAPSLWTRP